jgi:hypothetical protein
MASVYYQNRGNYSPRLIFQGLTTCRRIAENEYEYQMNHLKARQLGLLREPIMRRNGGKWDNDHPDLIDTFYYNIYSYIQYAYNYDSRILVPTSDTIRADAADRDDGDRLGKENGYTFQVFYTVDQINFTAQFEITHDNNDIFTIHVLLDPEHQQPGAELIEPGSHVEQPEERQRVLREYKNLLDGKFDVSDPPVAPAPAPAPPAPAPGSGIHNNPDFGFGIHSYFGYGGKRRARNTIRRKNGRSKNSRRTKNSRCSRNSRRTKR